MIGHRGASGYAPEHTLTSYFIAIEQGADYIEPDLVSTRDGVLIARHENEIGGTTDVASHPEYAARRTRKVIDGIAVDGWFTEDFTLEEIKRLRARERVPHLRPANARLDGQLEVPTFQEILALVRAIETEREAAAHERGAPPPKRIGLYPETKHPTYFAAAGLALEEPLLAALDRFGYAGPDAPVWIQSFEVGNLEALRARTRIRLVQLIEKRGAPYDLVAGGLAGRDAGARGGEAASYLTLASPAGLAGIAEYADAVGVEKSLVVPTRPDGTLADPTPLVAAAHAAGLAVHAWTFRAENEYLPPELRSGPDPAAQGDVAGEIARFLHAGIDGFFIDQPALGVRARDAFIEAARAAE